MILPHVVLCLAYQRERMAYQNSSSKPYIVVQWCSDTISEMTALVIVASGCDQCMWAVGVVAGHGHWLGH